MLVRGWVWDVLMVWYITGYVCGNALQGLKKRTRGKGGSKRRLRTFWDKSETHRAIGNQIQKGIVHLANADRKEL